MTEKEVLSNWYYFCSLSKQLYNTMNYVDHRLDSTGLMVNGQCFSDEFAKLLMLASSEFEVVCKQLCVESGNKIKSNSNIITLTKNIISLFPKIGETFISTPFQIVKPLEKWNVIPIRNKYGNVKEKVVGIDWWSAYNLIKHQRVDMYEQANLYNCVYALASLCVLELYLSRVALGNNDAISSVRCDYFSFRYGLQSLVANVGIQLPDFLVP